MSLVAPEGRAFQIVLAPQGRSARPLLRHAGIGLECRTSDAAAPGAEAITIVEAYARLLKKP